MDSDLLDLWYCGVCEIGGCGRPTADSYGPWKGYRRNDFETADGSKVCGYWFYVGDDTPVGVDGAGVWADRVYVSERRLAGRPVPPVGSPIDIAYNKAGKVSRVFF